MKLSENVKRTAAEIEKAAEIDSLNKLVEDVKRYLPDATLVEVKKIIKTYSVVHEQIASLIEEER